jgi:hypothetical protein
MVRLELLVRSSAAGIEMEPVQCVEDYTPELAQALMPTQDGDGDLPASLVGMPEAAIEGDPWANPRVRYGNGWFSHDMATVKRFAN